MQKETQKKIEVKLQLAEKYIRLAKVAGSKPKRDTFMFHANRFRNQARVIKMAAEQAESTGA